MPGLNKVARKLNIDCASAIVGFDFHGGWSHPIYDGFVVCQEFEDQLIIAWETVSVVANRVCYLHYYLCFFVIVGTRRTRKERTRED